MTNQQKIKHTKDEPFEPLERDEVAMDNGNNSLRKMVMILANKRKVIFLMEDKRKS